MIAWLWDRTLAFNRHPAYPLGLIIEVAPGVELSAITERRWSALYRSWSYNLDGYGDIRETNLRRILDDSDYIDAL